MSLKMKKKKINIAYLVYSISLLVLFLNIAPAISSNIEHQNYSLSTLHTSAGKNQADIPTWYIGDEWVYTVGPLTFSSPNGSFSGTIENFKQKIIQITINIFVHSF